MPVEITAVLVAGKTRPSVEAFTGLLEALWEEELVAPRAVVSVGPLGTQEVVRGADAVGAGREVRWRGEDLAGLVAAVRSAYAAEDVAVWFPSVDLDAFESPEEDEDEEDEDVELADNPEDISLGEFEIEEPTLCLHSARAPVGPKDPGAKAPAGAAWATLEGADMSLLADDLGDSWLRDLVEDALGKVKVAKLKR